MNTSRPCLVCNSGRQRCSESTLCFQCHQIASSEQLHDTLKATMNKGSDVIWIPEYGTYHEVTGVGKRRDEFSMCVFFANGKYACLDGCDISEFKITKRIE